MIKKPLFIMSLAVLAAIGCFSGYVGCSNEVNPAYEEETIIQCEFPNEDQLTKPIYKENVNASSIKGTMDRSAGGLDYVSVEYKTNDDFDTVVSWYEQKLGTPTETSTLEGGYNEAIWREIEGDFVSLVIVTQAASGTTISIIREQI